MVTAYLLASTITTPIAGKLGDLYGRKLVLQAALVVFLVGSALCGLSRNMPELIAFRAIQGLGGGALLVSTQAVIGDVVSPRERGRYSGLMGAVFGVSTVVGPLLGGLFVDHLSWRWIFYVNLPIGIAAFVVLQVVLHVPSQTIRHAIDYAGMALLAGGLTALVLYTSLGGTTYPWWSAQMVILLALAVALSVGFVVAERFAREPLVPLGLFRNRVFAVASAVGFIVGMALFGSVTYLPLYLQVVKGSGPTESGLQMLPLMAGVLVSSIGSGQLITRYGRYKVFPIVGTALMVVGLLLLSRLDVGTGLVVADLYMLVVGPRARLRHAGARARRPERRRLREPRGGDVDRDAVPVDGWGDRRPPLRGDLRQPALVAPLGEASAGSRGLPAGPPRPAADRRAAGGDPRPVRGGLCRVPETGLPDRRRDRSGRVPRHVAARGAPAAPDGRRPGARRQLRRAARPDVDGRAGGAAQLAGTQGEPPRRLRRLAAEAGLDLDARETWLLLRLDGDEGDASRIAEELRPSSTACAAARSSRRTGPR